MSKSHIWKISDPIIFRANHNHRSTFYNFIIAALDCGFTKQVRFSHADIHKYWHHTQKCIQPNHVVRASLINTKKSNWDPLKGFTHGDRGWTNYSLPCHRGVKPNQIQAPKNQFRTGDRKRTSAAESLFTNLYYILRSWNNF